MIEKIDKIQALLNVPNVHADTETAIANMKILNLLVDLRAETEQLILSGVSKSLPIGDVEILLIALEHIGKWGEEEEERWDDPGDCAMDALTQYRYSMSKGNVC